MKVNSMRNALGSLFVVMASVMLGSCGGGGAASPGPIGGPPSISPDVGTLYAGVEYTFTVAGGRPPYTLSSSEPQLLAVPTILNGNFFTVVPNNTGVVDTGLAPGSLPVRTVVISMRDTIGNSSFTSGLQVAQNFFTGYGYTLAYLSNCTSGTSSGASACAGGETALALSATIGGNLVGNRAYRFDIVRGPFFWVNANGTIAGNSITVNTDHEGTAHVIFRVRENVETQLAVFRVTDIATGTSTTQVFTIVGVPVNGALEVIPDELLFTGPNSATCGTGQADVLVFDGQPPYRATSSTANLTVTPETSLTNPGIFRIAATNPFVCLADATVVITDRNNSRTTVTVDTATGSAAPPPNPITVIPGSLSLDCGQQGSFTIAGGPTTGGSFTISKPGVVDPRVTAAAATRNITITRNQPDVGAVPAARVDETFTFTVTDSTNNTNTTTVSVIAPSVCPHL